MCIFLIERIDARLDKNKKQYNEIEQNEIESDNVGANKNNDNINIS